VTVLSLDIVVSIFCVGKMESILFGIGNRLKGFDVGAI
jgi:hypothetical protein